MGTREWITQQIGAEALEQLSSGLSGTQLQSLLLEVMQQRAQRRSPADLMAQYQRDGFVQPAAADLRVSLTIDQHFLTVMPQFAAIELAPVAPLGACSAVALTTQQRVLSALRSCEVVSDPTNLLALECATRLRAHPERPVHLATSQRVVRAQPHPKLPGFAPHFRLFALASGGLEAKDHAFTVDTLTLHIRSMLAALDRVAAHGFRIGARRVVLLATEQRDALAARVAETLRSSNIPIERARLDHAYYSGGIRYQIWVAPQPTAAVPSEPEPELPMIDGGAFDWLTKLNANRRAVFIASGAGTQLLALRFAPTVNSQY
ncbi:MAG TPA: hypothetical protein VMF89_26210 [Polyangiales bacterium]|nr:hypothetical protein [Polyangiales bacterium]